jgi:hypothetical protein
MAEEGVCVHNESIISNSNKVQSEMIGGSVIHETELASKLYWMLKTLMMKLCIQDGMYKHILKMNI